MFDRVTDRFVPVVPKSTSTGETASFAGSVPDDGTLTDTGITSVPPPLLAVNFTSTLPRRGRVMACPVCLAVIPAELTNF